LTLRRKREKIERLIVTEGDNAGAEEGRTGRKEERKRV